MEDDIYASCLCKQLTCSPNIVDFFQSRTFSVILSLMFHHSPLPFTIYDDDDVIIIIFTVMSSPHSKSNSFTFVGAEQPENFLGHFAVISFLDENLNGLQICSP